MDISDPGTHIYVDTKGRVEGERYTLKSNNFKPY